MTTKTKLPIITEQAIARCRTTKNDLSSEMKTKIGDETVCRKGCSHCCYHPILISVVEGVLLYWHLKNNGLWSKTLEFQLEQHTDQVKQLDLDIWLLSEIACPLLGKDNLCMGYSARPLICATTYSRALPDLCHSSNFSENTPWYDRSKALMAYYKVEQSVLQVLSNSTVMYPVSMAILIAHDTLTKGLSPEAVIRTAQKRLQ